MIKVLFVDDEILSHEGFISAIDWNRHGYEIIGTRCNGQDAMELITENNPHIVITDVKMPVMDGLELTKCLQRQFPNIKVIIQSAYSEFEYARAALKYGASLYLLKPEIEYEDILSALNDLKEQILSDEGKEREYRIGLINHQIDQKKKNLMEIMQNKPESADAANKRPFLLQSHHTCIYLSKDAAPNTLIAGSDIDIVQLEKEIQNIAPSAVIYPDEAGDFVVFVKDNYDKRESVYGIALEIKRLCTCSTGIGYTVGISLGTIPAVIYVQAKQASQYKFYEKPGSVMFWDQIVWNTEELRRHPSVGILLQLAEDENWTQLETTMDRLFTELSAPPYFPPSEVKEVALWLVESIGILLQRRNHSSEDVRTPTVDTLTSISQSLLLIDLHNIAKQYVNSLISWLIGKGAYSSIVREAMLYIKRNLHHDLSLGEVASQVHVSTVYLSQLFKKETDNNFNKFVTDLKMRTAQRLLRNKDLSITEIALELGYNNTSYFSKLFVKTFGVSPGNYRRTIK